MRKTLSNALLSFFGFIWALIFVPICFAWVTYIPASTLTLTGANSEVFFDVEDEIVNAGTSVPSPRFSTVTKTFSWSFYLTWAGWVDLWATWYGVSLDCWAQSLDNLSVPCQLIGTWYSEVIGEVLFDGDVIYNPGNWLLSWSASTFLWEYDMTGVMLPLLPATFREWTWSIAHHSTPLSISWAELFGNGPWTIGFTPLTTADRRDTSPTSNFNIDLSLASSYDVEVTDPQWSKTQFVYTVKPAPPSFILSPWVNYRSDFCTRFPLHGYCQDWATQEPSQFQGLWGSKVANGSDAYSVSLNLRDAYGNEVKEGDISIVYKDAIRTFQANQIEYLNFDDYCIRNIDNFCALITGGALLSNDDGSPETWLVPVIGGISYTIASLAPTSTLDTLTLSGVTYHDTNGIEHDITQPALKTPLVFTPWYTLSLSNWGIRVGDITEFTSTLTNTTPAVLPDNITSIYHVDIWSNSFASYRDFLWDNITCTKYVGASWIDMCDWVRLPDTSVVSLWWSSFSWVYTPYSWHPGPENVTYKSYVRYIVGATTVIYPSSASSLGMASAGNEYIKILGQDSTSYAGIGVDGSLASAQWNLIKKNISLIARGRTPTTGYDDVDYVVHTGSITVSDGDLHGSQEKRAIISIWGDITIQTDIDKWASPTLLLALMDSSGNGGDIIINPNVQEISSSLFAEKSIHSSWDMQLYIYGNVFSHNTLSSTKCPYYVSGVCDPTLYNLEELRADYADLASKVWHTSPAARAGEYPNTPLIIEYDGRLMNDPPPTLGK